MRVKSIGGRPFAVVINREEAERRYQLVVRPEDGSFQKVAGPMNWREFQAVHGFRAEWPHEVVGPVAADVEVCDAQV